MAHLARVVVPGIPHHVTQRGNRRETTFFEEADYRLYRDLLAEASAKTETEVWAYCLMPNHVHLILTPKDPDGLRRTLGDMHRRYTAHINARNRWTGHLWQGRFGSVAMDEDHLIAAVRYVSLNPVRASGATCRGLAVVQRPRPSGAARRRRGQGRSGAGPSARVRRFPRRAFRSGRRLCGASLLRDDRPTGWRSGLDPPPGAAHRPPAGAAQARPEATAASFCSFRGSIW
jgi:REP element-mobilizing transposase RayT